MEIIKKIVKIFACMLVYTRTTYDSLQSKFGEVQTFNGGEFYAQNTSGIGI
jgi:hypothetical protein